MQWHLARSCVTATADVVNASIAASCRGRSLYAIARGRGYTTMDARVAFPSPASPDIPATKRESVREDVPLTPSISPFDDRAPKVLRLSRTSRAPLTPLLPSSPPARVTRPCHARDHRARMHVLIRNSIFRSRIMVIATSREYNAHDDARTS